MATVTGVLTGLQKPYVYRQMGTEMGIRNMIYAGVRIGSFGRHPSGFPQMPGSKPSVNPFGTNHILKSA
jgi:hypothetical protein